MEAIKVTGCNDCPFCSDDTNWNCKVAENRSITSEQAIQEGLSPDWCPLKSEIRRIGMNSGVESWREYKALQVKMTTRRLQPN